MAISAVRLLLAFCLAGSCCSGLCQNPSSEGPQQQFIPDPVVYEAFFRQVSELKLLSNGAHPVTLNGDVDKLSAGAIPVTIPKIQDVIGMSDEDVEVLNATADDCLAKIAALQKAAGPLIFESRLQSAESGKLTETLIRKLKAVDDEHSRIVLDHVQQLKAELPDSSFLKMDVYVRTPSADKKALIPFGPRPVSSKGRSEVGRR